MAKETYQIEAEYTDTFGGQANYSWVERATLEIPAGSSDHTITRRLRKAFGLNGCGVKGRWDMTGDSWTFHPYGMCRVVMAQVVY